MLKLSKCLLTLVLAMSCSACTWSLEPLPHSRSEETLEGPALNKVGALKMVYEGQQKEVFQEIWEAHIENSQLTIDEKASALLRFKLTQYEYDDSDSLDLVPGVIFPGLVPFGPLAFWWTYEDLSVDTPSVSLVLVAEYHKNGQNSAGSEEVPTLKMRVDSTLGVTTEDNISRAALSLAVHKVLKWIENNRK